VLAHPGSSDYNGIGNNNYNPTADSAIVGAAIESGPAFSTSTTYNDYPTSMGFLAYYKKMLAKGYRMGPTIDHDNHYTTFGRTAYSRLAILAPSLTSSNFYTAMRNMNFYATQDCDTRLSFTVNNAIMGSEASGTTAPSININASDPTNPSAVPAIRIYKGVPGSGVDAVELAAGSGNTLFFTDNSLQPATNAYYYAEVNIAGAKSISAPVWYSRTTAVLALQLTSFTAVKAPNQTVNLWWNASKEETTSHYEVERSANGIDFKNISMQVVNAGIYKITDADPFDGLNYYRLKIVAKDGKITYSKVVAINFNTADDHSFVVYPNPVVNSVQLSVHSSTSEMIIITVTDQAGRTMLQTKQQVQKGNHLLRVNAPPIPAGTYFITLEFRDQKITQKMVKL